MSLNFKKRQRIYNLLINKKDKILSLTYLTTLPYLKIVFNKFKQDLFILSNLLLLFEKNIFTYPPGLLYCTYFSPRKNTSLKEIRL